MNGEKTDDLVREHYVLGLFLRLWHLLMLLMLLMQLPTRKCTGTRREVRSLRKLFAENLLALNGMRQSLGGLSYLYKCRLQ